MPPARTRPTLSRRGTPMLRASAAAVVPGRFFDSRDAISLLTALQSRSLFPYRSPPLTSACHDFAVIGSRICLQQEGVSVREVGFVFSLLSSLALPDGVIIQIDGRRSKGGLGGRMESGSEFHPDCQIVGSIGHLIYNVVQHTPRNLEM